MMLGELEHILLSLGKLKISLARSAWSTLTERLSNMSSRATVQLCWEVQGVAAVQHSLGRSD